jgi:ribonuclease HI
VREIWTEIKKIYGINLNLKNLFNIRQWILDWIHEASGFHATVLTITIWHIWENRNKVCNGEVLPHPFSVVAKIKPYIDFITLHDVMSLCSNMRGSLSSNQRWSPPQEGMLLINVDAVIFTHSGQAGFGVVVRDHQGSVQAASQGVIDHIRSPEVAEALALWKALVFAKSSGFQSIEVASDCLSLINKVQSSEFDRSSIGAIVQDIKTIALMFSACNFVHVKRCSNEAVHVLAKSAE